MMKRDGIVFSGIVVALSGALVHLGNAVVAREGDGEQLQPKTYTFDELAQGKIIGKLGKEVGTFCTVRGFWLHDPSRFKITEWYFHITQIDGKTLPESIEYPLFHVTNGSSRQQSWVESRRDSEVWEFRVYEGVRTYGSPPDFFKEAQIPPGSGVILFGIESELICVRCTSIVE